MLHQLASATIQVAKLVNFDCHPQENGNKRMPINELKLHAAQYDSNVVISKQSEHPTKYSKKASKFKISRFGFI